MNHQKIYDNIIQKARSEERKRFKKKDSRYVYYENHHIFPKCLGGRNEKENMQLLTAKEHYFCHKLLTYIYPKNKKLVDAFFYMTFSKKLGYHISLRDYVYARELFSLTPKTKETCEKISKANKGKKYSDEINKTKGRKGRIGPRGKIPWNKGKKTCKETLEKISKSRTGIKHTEEAKEKIRINHRKHQTEETKNKISIATKGIKKHTEETKEKMRNAKLGKPGHNKGKIYQKHSIL